MYNNQLGVNQILESFDIILSSRRDIEVIFIDDGSEIPIRIKSHPRVKLCKLSENMGVANARNIGLMHASGEWVVFLDSDDILTSNAFTNYDKLIAAPNLDFIAATFSSINKSKNDTMYLVDWSHKQISRNTFFKKNYCVMSGSIVKASSAKIVRFSNKHHEDLYFWRDICLYGTIVTMPAVCSIRSIGNTKSVSGNKIKSVSWHLNILRSEFTQFRLVYYWLSYVLLQFVSIIRSRLLRINKC